MITQDSLRFYKSHGVYKQFGGVVLASEEGERIADALGNFPPLSAPTANISPMFLKNCSSYSDYKLGI